MTSEQIVTPSQEQTKRCSRCEKEKSLDDFGNNSKGKFGKMAACKECENIRRSEYRKAHPEKRRVYNKAYREKNKDKRNAYEKLYRQKSKASPKKDSQRIHEAFRSRKSRLKHIFGITIEEYKNMLEAQDGVCAICKNPEVVHNKHGTLRSLAVDHDHQTGKVRGLLCHRCNTRLGIVEDTTYMSAATEYLNRNI